MSLPELHVLETSPTDADLAADYRARTVEALGPITAIMAEAHGNKMRILFNIGIDAAGRGVINSLEILKTL